MAKSTNPDAEAPDESTVAPAPVAQKPPPVRVTLSPAEWQKSLGTNLSYFNAAVTCHGWKEHKAHCGESMALSRSDYEAAIKAAVTTGHPHTPALSPYRGKGI